MNAAIYARKSTLQNVAEEAKSATRQVDGARAFIAKQEWTLCEANVYPDDAVSGASFDRPEFQRMMRDAANGAFKALVIFDQDRFSRADEVETMVAFRKLAEHGVTVYDYSTGQAVPLESWGGVITYLKAVVAKQFREQIRKHTRAALRRQAEAGYWAGGNVYGYDIVGGKKTKTLQPNDAQVAVVREIYARFARGEKTHVLAAHLNHTGIPTARHRTGWSYTTVRQMLEQPLYRGRYFYDRRTIEREIPAWRIVDLELQARVDARLGERRARYECNTGDRRGDRAHGKYLLTGGMLKCHVCDGNFQADQNKTFYVCGSNRRMGAGFCTNTLKLPIQATDEAVLDVVIRESLAAKQSRSTCRWWTPLLPRRRLGSKRSGIACGRKWVNLLALSRRR